MSNTLEPLLGNRFGRITRSVGFIHAPLCQTVAAFQSWLPRTVASDIRGPLEELVRALLPVTGNMTRELMVAARGGWTAYFDNSAGGADPTGPLHMLGERDGLEGIWVLNDDPRLDGDDVGGTLFALYRPGFEWGLARRLDATYDHGRWSWHEDGEVQPFERPEYYKKRRIKDRLPPELLQEYCRALGADPFNEDWYTEEAVLIRRVPRMELP